MNEIFWTPICFFSFFRNEKKLASLFFLAVWLNCQFCYPKVVLNTIFFFQLQPALFQEFSYHFKKNQCSIATLVLQFMAWFTLFLFILPLMDGACGNFCIFSFRSIFFFHFGKRLSCVFKTYCYVFALSYTQVMQTL